MADIKRAKSEAESSAVVSTTAVIFTVLADKFRWTPEQMTILWKFVEDLSNSVGEGRVSIADLKCVLREEYGIVLQ